MDKKNLVPIKVKIKVGPDGNHKFPNFNLIDSSIRHEMDWSRYFDFYGIGWHYDKCCGFGESDEYNTDPECWFGATCVPKDFAVAADALFDEVEVITEQEFEVFYNGRCHNMEPEKFYDKAILEDIKVRRALELQDDESVTKALDPDDPTPGIRKNYNKFWVDFSTKKGITIDSALRKT